MDVIVGGHFTLNSVDRSEYVESVEPSPDIRVEESTPFNNGSGTETSVRRDPGLIDSGSLSVTYVDDDSYTMLQALDAIKGTKVTASWRADDAVVSATNPEMSCTVIVPPFLPPVTQGAGARATISMPVDGLIAVAIT
jgi:hypothetical protein